MRFRRPLLGSILVAAACHAFGLQISAQTQTPPKSSDEVVRVNTELVQTDVMVFDKQGRFTPDLKMDQFELRIDGKVQPIEFFEMVSAGSVHDEEIWAKSEDRPLPPAQSHTVSNPGRTLLFFVDDCQQRLERAPLPSE